MDFVLYFLFKKAFSTAKILAHFYHLKNRSLVYLEFISINYSNCIYWKVCPFPIHLKCHLYHVLSSLSYMSIPGYFVILYLFPIPEPISIIALLCLIDFFLLI